MHGVQHAGQVVRNHLYEGEQEVGLRYDQLRRKPEVVGPGGTKQRCAAKNGDWDRQTFKIPFQTLVNIILASKPRGFDLTR